MGNICNNANENIHANVPKPKQSNSNWFLQKQTHLRSYIFYTTIQDEKLRLLFDTKDVSEIINKHSKSTYEKWEAGFKPNKQRIIHRNSVIPIANSVEVLDPLKNLEFDNVLKKEILTNFIVNSRNNRQNFSALLSEGVPNKFRWLSWMSFALSTPGFCFIPKQEYINFVTNTIDENIELQIRKDLLRSVPDCDFFNSERNIFSLYNILKALANYDHEISYCQGMNVLAGYMLILSNYNEIESFNMILYLFSVNSNVRLREFYLDGFPRVNMFIYIIKEIMKERYSTIYEKLLKLNIPDEIWLFKWFQGLFALSLPIIIVVRLWDCIFSQGIEFIIKFTLALINNFKEKILKVNQLEDFVSIFQLKFLNDEEMIIFREKLVSDALKIIISESYLLTLKFRFEKTETFNEYNKNKVNYYSLSNKSSKKSVSTKSLLSEFKLDQYKEVKRSARQNLRYNEINEVKDFNQESDVFELGDIDLKFVKQEIEK